MLREEASLQEIVKLVGQDALGAADRLTLESAKMIREDFLQQNAFLDVDCYTSLEKQHGMLRLIFHYADEALRAVRAGVDAERVCTAPAHEKIARAKTVPEDRWEREFAEIAAGITGEMDRLIEQAGEERV